VQEGVNGFVLRENPSDLELSRTIGFLLDTATRRTMGENARKSSIQYSWDKTADRVSQVYEQLSS
jgi:glycosyltransferase involved in cell wall biosynthesis